MTGSARPGAARLLGPLGGGPPRVMIIGASGFLGRHVRDGAAAAGMDVITAGRSPLPGSRAHCLLDLTADEPAGLAATLAAQAPDVVVNCAGATGGDIAELAAANMTGTASLVRALRRTGRVIRLVHLGSAAEYGPSVPGTAVAESAPARPAGAYGVTKLAATRLIELGRATGLDAVVLRVFNPVGPGAPATTLPGRLVSELRQAAAARPGRPARPARRRPRLRRRPRCGRCRRRRRSRAVPARGRDQRRQRRRRARPHPGPGAGGDQRV